MSTKLKPYIIVELTEHYFRGPGPWFIARRLDGRMLPFDAPVLERSGEACRLEMRRAHPDYAYQPYLIEGEESNFSSTAVQEVGEGT